MHDCRETRWYREKVYSSLTERDFCQGLFICMFVMDKDKIIIVCLSGRGDKDVAADVVLTE